jgi:dienelactone hydrolase
MPLTSPDITGSPSSTRGIIHIYDAFGLFPQTLQGSDRLAASLNAIVLVPDFLEGSYAQEEWYSGAPKDEATKAAEASFMTKMANFQGSVEALVGVTREAREKFPLVEGWGVFGLCWGGKVGFVVSEGG